ncbi:chemosensory receptor c [Plakobranchus ocellatus]|uniref:Chemosensory receptor c n=1 Tax=Plakobranchus ocellatus TaxID=259542 RepID=A0AAV3YS16_9GAST|nr:chemosensory receptor c [Plakobranchus ocellatus]
MGLRDNVTITLLVLSMSDLINLILNCPTAVARIILEEKPSHEWPFDHMILIAGIYWYAYVFYDYSSMVSVFLAVVRCLCVAKPLAFKFLVTKARTLISLVTIFIFSIILRIPVFTVFQLASVKHPRTNSSFVQLVISSDYSKMYRVNDIMNRTIISWLAYTTVTVCVFIMVYKLKQASNFRRSAAGLEDTKGNKTVLVKNERSEELSVPDTDLAINKESKPTSPKRQIPSAEKLSTKDLQVVQSVTLICIIFILSQLPFQVTSVYRLIEPEFDNRGRLSHLFKIASYVTKTFGLLNASVNFFVYIRYNSRYRETLRALICAKKR